MRQPSCCIGSTAALRFIIADPTQLYRAQNCTKLCKTAQIQLNFIAHTKLHKFVITNPTQLYRKQNCANSWLTFCFCVHIVSWTKCAVICMWGLLLPHCNDCASKLLPTRANIGTQQCIVLADICVLANWWTRQIHAVLADFCVLVYWWTGHHTAALANSCCAGCYFSKLMARTWGAWPLFFNHLKMFSLPMNVDDRGDNEVEKKLETSKLMQRTPCPCYCYQKDRLF